MPLYGGWLGGGAVCPLCRETASSEAEIGHLLEGRSAVLERGGDAFARSRVPRGALERVTHLCLARGRLTAQGTNGPAAQPTAVRRH